MVQAERIGQKLTPLLLLSFLSTLRGWWTWLHSLPIIIWHPGFKVIWSLLIWCSTLMINKMTLNPNWIPCFRILKRVTIKSTINFYLIFLALNISIRWTQSFHSDLCTGDLHIAPGNTGPVPAAEVSFLTFFMIILNFNLYSSSCKLFSQNASTTS